VRFVNDEELAYIMLRYRQVHDFWHVLAGLPPSVLAEIALKWFELSVTGLPVCALSSFVGPLRLSAGAEVIVLVQAPR
jgi:ubiquinone biosynthesis protein COQ4